MRLPFLPTNFNRAVLPEPEVAAAISTETPLSKDCVADSLFGDHRFRPTPLLMQSLIHRGLSEGMIITAADTKGYKKPKMDATLEELDIALPYFQQISDKLATDHSDETLLFAARDGEAVFDDFAICYPKISNYLLPASSDLWYSSGMMNKKTAETFLAGYGVSQGEIQDNDKKFVLVDSGFYGNIGIKLDETVKRLYNCSLLNLGRLSVKLVCADLDGNGEQIIDLPVIKKWPKHDLARNAEAFPDWTRGNTFGLAVGMQLMPRYHGTFRSLGQDDSGVVALPDREWMCENVDQIGFSVNQSVVSPVAAAIVQFRIVKAAMERSSCGDSNPGKRLFAPFSILQQSLRGLLG